MTQPSFYDVENAANSMVLPLKLIVILHHIVVLLTALFQYNQPLTILFLFFFLIIGLKRALVVFSCLRVGNSGRSLENILVTLDVYFVIGVGRIVILAAEVAAVVAELEAEAENFD